MFSYTHLHVIFFILLFYNVRMDDCRLSSCLWESFGVWKSCLTQSCFFDGQITTVSKNTFHLFWPSLNTSKYDITMLSLGFVTFPHTSIESCVLDLELPLRTTWKLQLMQNAIVYLLMGVGKHKYNKSFVGSVTLFTDLLLGPIWDDDSHLKNRFTAGLPQNLPACLLQGTLILGHKYIYTAGIKVAPLLREFFPTL